MLIIGNLKVPMSNNVDVLPARLNELLPQGRVWSYFDGERESDVSSKKTRSSIIVPNKAKRDAQKYLWSIYFTWK